MCFLFQQKYKKMIQVIFTGLAHKSYFENEESKASLRNQLKSDLDNAMSNCELVFNHFVANESNSDVFVFSVVSDLVEANEIEFMIGGVSDNDNEKFDSEEYLNGVLDKRDESLGLGGNYTFCIDLERAELRGNYVKMIHIPNLTKDASRKLFDLFDENNSPNGFEKIRIRLMEGDKEIDLNYIPNIHSHTT